MSPYMCIYVSLYVYKETNIAYKETNIYGVATISRMLKNTGLFAEYRSLL